MDLRLKDRAALVTGASAGIGKAVAATLAAEGCRVAMVARRPEVLAGAAEQIVSAGSPRPFTRAADVADADVTRAVVNDVAQELGGLDIVVNNVPAPGWGNFVDHDDAEWEFAWRTKFLTYVRTSRLAIPYLSGTGRGVIMNIIGIGGKMAIKE